MIKTKIYITGLDEENSGILENKVAYINGVEDYDLNSESIEISHDENIINEQNLIFAIEGLGFDVLQKRSKESNMHQAVVEEPILKKGAKKTKTKIYVPDIECESC